MPSLWLPGAEAEAQMHMAAGRDEAKRVLEFGRRLKVLDSRLDCFLQTQDRGDFRAGFWYVVRHNEDGSKAFWEVRNPDGSYREPDEAVIEMLRRNDANRTDLNREWQQRQRREKEAEEREAQRKRDETAGLVKERMDYAFRVQHRIKDKPWEKNAA